MDIPATWVVADGTLVTDGSQDNKAVTRKGLAVLKDVGGVYKELFHKMVDMWYAWRQDVG